MNTEVCRKDILHMNWKFSDIDVTIVTHSSLVQNALAVQCDLITRYLGHMTILSIL